jgi:potassium efflux system protein
MVLLPFLVLFGISAFVAPPARGDAAATGALSSALPGIPGKSEIEARIKAAEADTGMDEAARTALLDAYRRALAYLDSARETATKATELSRTLEEAPRQTARLRAQLEADKGPADEPEAASLSRVSSDELGQQLAKTQAEVALRESRIGEIEKLLEGSGNRAKEARARLAEVKQAMDQLDAEAQKPPPPDQSAEMTQATGWASAARRQALKAESGMLEQEIASQSVRDELYRAQRDQLAAELGGLRASQKQLEEEQNQRRKAEAEQAREDAETAQREAVDKHPLVQQAVQENSRITESLSHLASQLERFAEEQAQIERERKRIEGDFRGARERIDVAGVNQALGLVLLDRRNELPDLREHRKAVAARNDAVAEAMLRQIRYREQQRALRDMETALADLTEGDAGARTPEVQAELRQTLEQRRTLIDKAVSGTEDYIRKQGEINDAAEQLIQVTKAYDAFLAQHLLWVRSARTISLETLTELPGAVAWLVSAQGWAEVLRVLAIELTYAPLTWLGVLVVLLLLWKHAALKRAIMATAEPLRRIRTDRFRYTLEALGLTLLAALPWPLLLLLLGRALTGSIEAKDFSRAIGGSLTYLALGLFYLRAFRVLCLPGGIADRHFRWEGAVLTRIRGNLRWFTPFIALISLVAYSIFYSHDTTHGTSLGRLMVFAAMIGVTVFFARLLHPGRGVLARLLADNPDALANRLRNLWYPTVVGAPIALAILAILGYTYTAGTLFHSLVQTAWLALGLVILQQMIVRWLVLTRRRLALQAALERQAARRAQTEGDKTSKTDREAAGSAAGLEEPEVDLATLDEQTRKLLGASVFFAALFGIWLIWLPMLPALGIFDQMTLWHYQRTLDGTPQAIPVSVADMGLVLLILIIALVAGKNLPALIEILLLQAPSVTAGTRYAIRTLLSYAITAIAFLTAFGTLGLSWSQVQWLVAALSVGIGFGLQEIVANFISGLIILFERPVRVGDVVTIGDTTGTVTRIEIRATTIRNWDRQELIVPNKEFITGRLLNWTLTDQLNRITITVGVDYGTDPALALSLLSATAAANPRILKDPAPLVTFESFGDNALMLVLRCFLDAVDARLAVTTEMHLAIERAFREHGIGFAFPQREIHLSAREPIDVRLYRARPATGD